MLLNFIFVFLIYISLLYFYRNDWVGISTVDSGSETLLCRYLEQVTVLIQSSHVNIGFNAWAHGEGDGFSASYQAVQNDITSMYDDDKTCLAG